MVALVLVFAWGWFGSNYGGGRKKRASRAITRESQPVNRDQPTLARKPPSNTHHNQHNHNHHLWYGLKA